MGNSKFEHIVATVHEMNGETVTADTDIAAFETALDREISLTRQTKVKVEFVCGQFEKCPKTGKIHLQVCVIVNKPIELEHWKNLMTDICGNHVHCQVRKHGNSESAKDYCMKDSGVDGDRLEGTNPFMHGDFRYTECSRGQGERTDASAVYAWMKENVGKSFHVAMDAWEGTPSFHFLVSNRKWYSETMLHLEQVQLKEEILQEHAELNLYPWQQGILNIVSPSAGRPDSRLIDVVVDTTGGCGKSLLTSILSTSYGFISLGNCALP